MSGHSDHGHPATGQLAGITTSHNTEGGQTNGFHPASGFCLTLLARRLCTLHLRSDATFIVSTQRKPRSMITCCNKAWKLNNILATDACSLEFTAKAHYFTR